MVALGVILLVLCLLFLIVILVRQAPTGCKEQEPKSNKTEGDKNGKD